MQAEAMPLVQTLQLTEEDEPSVYAVLSCPPAYDHFCAGVPLLKIGLLD
jgi:hypothetical protein